MDLNRWRNSSASPSGYFLLVLLLFCGVLSKFSHDECSVIFNQYGLGTGFVGGSDNHLVISSCLRSFSSNLLLDLAGRRPFVPNRRLSVNVVFLSLLLLVAGVEPNPGPSIRLGLFNINSLLHKSTLVHDILSDFGLDCLLINETRLRDDDPPAVKLDAAPLGFQIHLVCRRSLDPTTRGGGLAIINRSELLSKPHGLQSTFHPKSFELQTVSISFGTRRLLIINVYRPPWSSVSEFRDEFAELVTLASAAVGVNFMILGDMNMPGCDGSSIDFNFGVMLDQMDLEQLVHHPTRKENLLDLIILPKDSNILSNIAINVMEGTSDHSLVHCCLESPEKIAHVPETLISRNIKRLDRTAFMKAIMSSDLYVNPANTCCDFSRQIRSTIIPILDRMAPMVTKKKRVGKSSNHWLTDEARAAKRIRRQRERQWKSSRSEQDRILYRQSCREANRKINSARQTHFKNRLEESRLNPKKRWSIIKELLHSKPEAPPSSPQEDETLSASFGEFFIGKIDAIRTRIRNLLAGVIINPFSHDLNFTGTVFSNFSSVSVDEVRTLLRKISNKTSPLDYVPTSLLKECEMVFAPLIARLANLAFQQGVFPDDLKSALVSPLLKKSGLDASAPGNFRPISNLNTIGKLLERLVLVRLQPHLTSSSSFNVFQSAYRAGHSTETALLRIMNDALRQMDKKCATMLVALDLSAAFDTIDHSILLSRLEHTFGVTGNALGLLHSYLLGRTQTIKVGTKTSRQYDCSVGVPQGSVLGPLLFIAFISPVARVAELHGTGQHQYADDTSLYVSFSSVNKQQQVDRLERCLEDVRSWFNHNGLALNPEKSEVLHLCPIWQHQPTTSVLSLNVAGSAITPSATVKSLGVTLDTCLSFDQHVKLVCGNAFYHIRALRHIRRSISTDCAKVIAGAIVGSRLDYCNSLLHNTSTSNLNALQRVQNTAAKVVSCAKKFDHVTPLMRSLHWLPVASRIKFKMATLTFRALRSRTPFYLAELIHEHIPTRDLRSSAQGLLDVPRTRTVTGDRAFSISAPSLWNELPAEVRCETEYGRFKSRLKTHLFRLVYL